MKITPGVYETRGGDTATVRDADWDADGYDLIKRIGDLPKGNL